MRKHFAFGLAAALSVVMADGSALAGTIFGSKLNHEPTPPEDCNSNHAKHMCTFVLTTANSNVGHEKAPRNGTVVKIRLRSCTSGTFVLQLATAFPGTKQAKVRRSGPLINYKGSSVNCNGGLFIETFNVNVPVLTGDYLAVVGTRVGFVNNSSGGGVLAYDPPLADGGGLRSTTGVGLGSGNLLLQAEYNN